MAKDVVSEIAYHQERISAHKKGYIGPGVILLGAGIVMPHLGILETPDRLLDIFKTGVEYVVLGIGAAATAMGLHEIGVETGQISILQRQDTQPPIEIN